ncbi:hypothetical protein V6N13_072623 [Hibiscus sabdariffa]
MGYTLLSFSRKDQGNLGTLRYPSAERTDVIYLYSSSVLIVWSTLCYPLAERIEVIYLPPSLVSIVWDSIKFLYFLDSDCPPELKYGKEEIKSKACS